MMEVMTKTKPPSDYNQVITIQPKIIEENQKTHKTSSLRRKIFMIKINLPIPVKMQIIEQVN
jgi:hypothetical protein